jgi:hypothetical protein
MNPPTPLEITTIYLFSIFICRVILWALDRGDEKADSDGAE